MCEEQTRFVGGANVPAWLGRMNATWPLAVLVISPSRMLLGIRGPKLFGHVEELDAAPADLRAVYPVRGLWSAGVGFTDGVGGDFFFWSSKGDRVLRALSQWGYPVEFQERRATKVWSMQR